MHKCDSHRSYFFLSTVLRSLILMQTEITYFSLSLASSHHHLLPSTATLSSKIVLQSKWRAGNPTPSPLPEPQTMWMLCIHSRTKSLPLGTFPSNSLSCCPVVCVSFLYLGICCSLALNCANEESSAVTVPRSGFGSTQQVTDNEGKQSSIIPLPETSFLFPAGLDER